MVTIITPTHILTASVGDSRCVIGTSEGVCIAMAEDHKVRKHTPQTLSSM